jgi:hypothetical protein
VKKYASVLVAITFVLGLGVAAKAETRDAIVVKVPFEFVVFGKTLPAGKYTLSTVSSTGFAPLLLTNNDSGTSMFLPQHENEGTSVEKPLVVFQRVGGESFLSAIRTTSTVYNFTISQSAIMEAAARSRDNSSASGVSGSD